jgi:Tetracyclin repressor-like, C-terminal domain
MREAAHALVRSVPAGRDRALILWMIETVSHAVIHGGVVERSEDAVSGRLEEELVRLLLAYLAARRE